MSDCIVNDDLTTNHSIQGNNSSTLVFHPIPFQIPFLVNADDIIDCRRDFSAVLIQTSKNITELIARQRSPRSCVVSSDNLGAVMVASNQKVNFVPFSQIDRVIPVVDHQSLYYIHELYTTSHGDRVFVRVSLAYGLCQVEPTNIYTRLGNCTSESSSFYHPSCHGDFIQVIIIPPPECLGGNELYLPVNDDIVVVNNEVKYMSFHATDVQMHANRSGCEHMFTPSAKAVLRVQFNNTLPERSQSITSMTPDRSSSTQARIELIGTSGKDGVVEYISEECLPIDHNCRFTDLFDVSLRFNETIANQTFSRISEIIPNQQNATCDVLIIPSQNITFENTGVLRLYQMDPNLIVELGMNISSPSIDTVRITLQTEQGQNMLGRSFSIQNKLSLYMNPNSPYFNDIFFCRAEEFANLTHLLCQNRTSEPFIDRFIFNPHLWGITSGYFKVYISVLATVATSTGRQLMSKNSTVIISSSNTSFWITIRDSSTKENVQGSLFLPLFSSFCIFIIVLYLVLKRLNRFRKIIDYQLII